MAKKRKKKLKMDPVSKVILSISVVVFCISGGFLLYKYVGEPILEQIALAAFKDDYNGADTHGSDNGVWTAEEDDNEERLENGVLASFKTMLDLNSDVVGWITIPNTPIDYPVVQTKNNSYYLGHNINKEENHSGCPFLDYRNIVERGKRSKCSIIYAHHRRNGTMFAKLTKYNEIDFYKQNPVIRFDTIYDRSEWVVFANMRCSTNANYGKPFVYIRTSFKTDEDYEQFIKDIRERSLIDTPIEVTKDDDILLLSTCSYERSGWKMVVAARRVRSSSEVIDVTSAKMAANPLMPK